MIFDWSEVKSVKFSFCWCIVYVIGTYTEVFLRGGGDFVFGVGFRGDDFDFPCGGKFLGVTFPGEILYYGNSQNFCTKILFICLTFSSDIQFCTWRCSGEIAGKTFSTCLNFAKIILRKGEFLEGWEKRLELIVFLKWKLVKPAKASFSGWIFCKKFYVGERGFSVSGRKLKGWCILCGKYFTWRVFPWGERMFHGGWISLSALFEKQSEIKLKNQVFCTESKEQH